MEYLNCNICELRCRIHEGRSGICGRYELKENEIIEKYPDQYLVACPISIETMPILHYRPKGKFFQVSTTGCNFNCPGCISTVLVREMSPDSRALIRLTPREIVLKALETECEGIVFLMNDPISAFPGFLKTAEIAHKQGLKVGCSSNTYFTSESLNRLMPFLDFINIGMKGFSDEAYISCGAPWISPVLRNIKTLYKGGVHIEVSCIFTNRNQQEIMELAGYIADISREIPLQIMRFLPFEAADISFEPSVREAEAFCERVRKVLDYVYLFNTPGSPYLHTICPQCSHSVIARDFYGPMGAKVKPPVNLESGDLPTCPSCSYPLNIVGPSSFNSYQEGDFEGGYPLTRAMEMVEAMLIAMGITSKSTVIPAWEEILQDGGLKKLHMNIQHPRRYIEALRHFGKKAGVDDRAEKLAFYLEDRLNRIEGMARLLSERPRTYYAMAKPLFYINGGRLENQLVETAGGYSVNRDIPQGGRPGATITIQELNRLNPEVMFISAFISNSVDDFRSECIKQKIDVEAVRNNRIYKHPAPGWDFGSPRWILGLMYIASILHPDKCQFDVMEEAKTFYRDFYGLPFDPKDINLSFSKPDSNWRWQE
jgi:pyruvate formate lyase activating enzyme